MPFSAEELRERQGFLGASECSAALGLSSWFTPLQLFESKRGAGEPIEETIPMMVGVALEPTVLRLAEKELGAHFSDHQVRLSDPLCPWRRATIDAFWPQENAIIEAKTSGDFRGWGEKDDEIPLPYLYNIHHTFACMPMIERAYFPVLIGGRTFRIYEITRDEHLVDLVRQGEGEFWHEHVLTGKPPPPVNAEDLKILYPRDYGKHRAASGEEAKVIHDLKETKNAIRAMEKVCVDLSNQVKEIMGDHAALMGSTGKPLVTWKSQTERRVDLEALRSGYPEVAAAVTKTSEVRKLLVK